MNWLEIKARGVGRSKARAVSILIKAGSPGVLEGVSEPSGLIEKESRWGGGGGVFVERVPKGKLVSFTAYLRDSTPRKLREIKKGLERIGWSFTASSYRDRDWSRQWAAGIKTVRVAGGGVSIVITPSWRKVKGRRGDVVIEMDPGMAFGTGSHETTRMCIKALLSIIKREAPPEPLSLLDVGTGTGILAITAKKLGAEKVVANDIDAVALKVARKNARKSGVRVLLTGRGVEEIKGRFSIIAANILYGELLRLAPLLLDRLLPGGYLILSGLLKGQSAGVREAYSSLGLKLHKGYSKGEWRTMVFRSGGL